MQNKLLALALFVPFVCLLTWLGYMTYQRETGRDVTVAVMGYDPRDLLSGHYIRYQIDWEHTNCAQFADKICPTEVFGREGRFYIPEKNARALDILFANRNTTGMVFEVVYAYQKGKTPIAKQLLINGADWWVMLNK